MPRKDIGELRIIGTELHLIGEDGLEYMFQGDYVDHPAGGPKKGSCWIDTDLFYIDALGDKRKVSSIQVAAVPARIGSAWIATKNMFWVDNTQNKRMAHIDASHADRAAYSDYGDYSSHNDSHGDWPGFQDHYDGHTDYQQYSDHGDYSDVGIHYDYPHGDAPAHGDWHGDHVDDEPFQDSHGDSVYSDHGDSYPHADATHADMPQLVP